MKHLFIAVIYLVVLASGINAQDAIIINHTCTDISKIPDNWIDSVQARIRLHYAHTSHGSQLTTGLAMIENNFTGYDYAIGSRYLPVENGSLCIFYGQEYATYITPELYWSTTAGMQNTGNALTNNPELNVSMWSWCGQMSSNDSDEVQRYIDSIEVLEARYPQVQFVFMTGHTDGTGSAGDDNLRASNNQLREYCIANGKVLYDFGDIESWDPDSIYYENTSDNCAWCSTWCNEHPDDCPSCSSCAHSHCYNCFIKGKAFWWMLARLAGWEGENPAGDYTEQNAHICEGDSIFLGSAYQTIPGVYYDTLENVNGLDSIIVTMLHIISIDTSVIVTNGYLSASESNAVYQWINCTSNLKITGATSKDFKPEDDGLYAVEISKNGCIQISGCHQIISVDLERIINSKGFIFSPNPVIDFLNIDLGREYLNITLRVIDIRGNTLFANKYSQKQSIQTNFRMMRDGLYFVQIYADDRQKVIRITKISHY